MVKKCFNYQQKRTNTTKYCHKFQTKINKIRNTNLQAFQNDKRKTRLINYRFEFEICFPNFKVSVRLQMTATLVITFSFWRKFRFFKEFRWKPY